MSLAPLFIFAITAAVCLLSGIAGAATPIFADVMKRILSLFLSFLFAVCLASARTAAPLVQPAFWWAGMARPSLQVMLYGDGIGQSDLTLRDARGVTIDSIVRPANSRYLFLYLHVAGAAPQRFQITLRQGRKMRTIPYDLLGRNNLHKAQGFDASDVVYLLMPDRFANADPHNDVVKGLREQTSSQAPDARHGGDLAGMTCGLDYLANLGVTAVWPTPLLINDMPGTSYHGYAITDYYRIDPRYGSNEDYLYFVKIAHSKGIKVIQDMVFNHCGSENFLFRDRPDSTWFNYDSHYVQTSYKILSVGDPHGAAADRRNAQDGWFVEAMPDFNQRNPHVLNYLIQNSLWWIEYAGIDGIRQDTYPYIDRKASAQWCQAVLAEYPHFNIVGETWLGSNVGVSYWQRHSPVANGDCDSNLPTVMDFPLYDLLNQALDEETDDWNNGLSRIYNYVAQDAVYADPMHLLTFLSNHDTPRFAHTPAQAADTLRYRQALTLLLTLRGIPQLYYGDELAMAADKSKGDGALRQNFPGGFPGDSVSAFTGEARLSPLQRTTLNLTRRLLHWRKGNAAIARGTLTHYAVRDGIYAYARRVPGRTVTVILNGTGKDKQVDLKPYADILPHGNVREVLTGRTFSPSEGMITVQAHDVVILDGAE